jgi:hypothetical protein
MHRGELERIGGHRDSSPHTRFERNGRGFAI